MSAGPEQFVVVSFDGNDVMAVTNPDGVILSREYGAVKNDVHGVLSSEEEIDSASDNVRYAVPVDLARTVFGWEL